MTKGFADQPIGGGLGQLLESKNSKNTEMTATSIGFSPAPLFANANGEIFYPTTSVSAFTNADGYRNFDLGNLFGSGMSFKDVADITLKMINDNAAAQRIAEANNDAKELQRLKIESAKIELANIQAQANLEKEKKANKTNYTMPILVTGGVIILGIGAYFIFRKIGK